MHWKYTTNKISEYKICEIHKSEARADTGYTKKD